jgi:hypothetical protein
MLLEEIDAEPSATERARLYRELGRVYERDLHDVENALVAFTQAVLESPADDDLAARPRAPQRRRRRALERGP